MPSEIRAGGGQTGRVQLIAACRRLAISDGTTLEEALWEAVRGMIAKAAEGNVAAFEQVMKWLSVYEADGAEPKDKGGAINLGVGVNFGANDAAKIGESPDYAAEVDRVITELAPPKESGFNLERLLE